MTQKIFKCFEDIQKLFKQEVIEVSVKRSQVTLVFSEKMIGVADIEKFSSEFCGGDKSFVTFDEEFMYLVCELEDNTGFQELFGPFLEVTQRVFDEVCKCPIFEFIVSSRYIKLYLDKQGLTVKDLKAYEDIFDDTEGTLELHGQRPYLLFINMNFAGDI